METNHLGQTEYYRFLMHKEYMDKEMEERAAEILNQPLDHPIFKPKYMHPEDVSTKEIINKSLKEISYDIAGLDFDISEMAISYKLMLEDFEKRIEKSKADIERERNRLRKRNLLCHRYQDFSHIDPVDLEHDVKGRFSIYEKYASLSEKSASSVRWNIVNIDGNGYPGNDGVYDRHFRPLIEKSSTHSPEVLREEDPDIFYEYSRISSEIEEEKSFFAVNYDQNPVRCTMEFSAPENINQIFIKGHPDTFVNRISVSNDGKRYRDLEIERKSVEKDCVFFILPSRFIKISFDSDKRTDERIGFEDNNGEIVFLNSAKRSRIKLNYIEMRNVLHEDETTLEIENINADKVEGIALYAEEIIPKNFGNEKYIEYEFIVNDVSYPIVPVNSLKEGEKAIFTTQNILTRNENTIIIRENIEKIRLKIYMKGYDEMSPYLSDITLLLVTERGEEDI